MTFAFHSLYNRIRLLFIKQDKKSYLVFYKMLGFLPRDITYYKEATIHKSKKVYHKGHLINNERLEFLGDAVLDAIVADIAFNHFKNKEEGYLTNIRAKIVNREILNKIACKIGLDKLVRRENQQIMHSNSIFGNAFEALIGAIYMDQGYDKCKTFFMDKIFRVHIYPENLLEKEVNFKSHLLEWCQKNKLELSFKTINQTRDETVPLFISEVVISGICCNKGQGHSKKESHQKAAQATLNKLKNDRKFYQEVLSKSLSNIKTPLTEANS